MSETTCLRKLNSLNHNVKVALLYSSLASFGRSIWYPALLSGYVKVLTESNSKVGLITGIQGACQVFVAFPAGFAADRFRRDSVLKVSAHLGHLAVFTVLLALFSEQILGPIGSNVDVKFTMLCIGLGFWGAYVGTYMSPLEALYADSTTDANRTTMNQYKYSLFLIGSSSGPLTTVLLFYFFGDTWTLNELRTVFCCGLIVSFPSLWSMYYFDDNAALTSKSKSKVERNLQARKDFESNENEELLELLLETDTAQETIQKSFNSPAHYWVPRILVGTHLLNGFATGMADSFFPLFFKEETLLKPSEVTFNSFVSFFLIALSSYFARVTGDQLGRINILLLYRIPGSLLLTAIYFMSIGYDTTTPGNVPLWRNKSVIIPVYLLRMALMNSTRPIRRAIMMEYVPPKERAVWNSFESLTQFCWAGSAVVGGYLVDGYGYGFMFLVSSVIQLLYVCFTGILKIYLD